jgi:hypothetical protein
MVSVVQREWTAKNPRATFKTPINRRVSLRRMLPPYIVSRAMSYI